MEALKNKIDMKVIISSHFDIAKPVKYVKVDKQGITGLVDNFPGVFAAYKASRQTGAELYLTNFEEKNLGGAIAVAKNIKKEKAVVIVVDVCTDEVGKKKAYIGNVYNFPIERLKKKFGREIFFRDGYFEPTEDETAIYGWDNKFPSFFFGLPIKGDYHDTDNKISNKDIDEATTILVKVINFISQKF
jgi:hypothetical protein